MQPLKGNSIYKDETTLVHALKNKDKMAFSYLYDHYSNALFGVIDRITQSNEIAEDVLQESFLKIWKNIEFYTADKGTIFTWMLNICRNTAIDTVRSKAYKNESMNQNVEDNVYSIDLKEQVEAKVDHIGIKSIVSKLKPEHKILIDKVYFEGYTQDEVSKELNIPLGTVKTRLRAALIHLRTVIK